MDMAQSTGPLDQNSVMRWLSDPDNADAFVKLRKRQAAKKSARWRATRAADAVEV